ncbi:MAG: hypothetical protein H0U50_04385 [Pyrinomonadaceae bacterium]|nr:hypothetical protein [Pyrinomonadaceae bacterium]
MLQSQRTFMEKKNGNKSKKIMPYGLRDYSQTPLEEMSPEMREYVIAGREALKAIAEAIEKTESAWDFSLMQNVMPKLEVIPAKEFFG